MPFIAVSSASGRHLWHINVDQIEYYRTRLPDDLNARGTRAIIVLVGDMVIETRDDADQIGLLIEAAERECECRSLPSPTRS